MSLGWLLLSLLHFLRLVLVVLGALRLRQAKEYRKERGGEGQKEFEDPEIDWGFIRGPQDEITLRVVKGVGCS